MLDHVVSSKITFLVRAGRYVNQWLDKNEMSNAANEHLLKLTSKQLHNDVRGENTTYIDISRQWVKN
jgi:hypothetical protein